MAAEEVTVVVVAAAAAAARRDATAEGDRDLTTLYNSLCFVAEVRFVHLCMRQFALHAVFSFCLDGCSWCFLQMKRTSKLNA
jgi:hypothetical protein